MGGHLNRKIVTSWLKEFFLWGGGGRGNEGWVFVCDSVCVCFCVCVGGGGGR